jgi:hypothetical protein
MVRQVTPVHVDFGRRMYSPSQRVNQICGIFPDEIGRMNVPEFSGDRNEVVNAARLEESFLRVQTKLDRGDAIAVQNHVEVSPETPGRSYCTKSIKINIAYLIMINYTSRNDLNKKHFKKKIVIDKQSTAPFCLYSNNNINTNNNRKININDITVR